MLPLRSPSSSADLNGFLIAQRIAYSCVSSVEASLQEGMTEREAAELLRARFADAGVRHYFHVPLAWFGDRTELADDWSDAAFLPTSRALERGMPVILDVAPIVNGYVADIGYSFPFGENALMTRMLHDLAVYRTAIPYAIRAGRSLAEAYQLVDALIEVQGYYNRHRAYPFGVMGHRVTRLQPGSGDEKIEGAFGTSALAFFRERMAASETEPSASPLWSGRRGVCAWHASRHLGSGAAHRQGRRRREVRGAPRHHGGGRLLAR